MRLFPELNPHAVTLVNFIVAALGAFSFFMGRGVMGGVLIFAAEVLDGCDGQVARLRDRVTREGAFLDSVMDRYGDLLLISGLTFYCMNPPAGSVILPETVSGWVVPIIGLMAMVGAFQVSYAADRGAALGIRFKREWHAGRGTRMSVIAAGGILSTLHPASVLLSLLLIAVHTNIVTLERLISTLRGDGPES